MIRLTHLTGSRSGQVDESPKAVLRVGRAGDCDVRFDGTVDRTVSSHHAEIRFDGQGGYQLVDTNSSNGTLVNGQRVLQHQLANGDVIFIGGDSGPQLRFEMVQEAFAGRGKAPTRPDDQVQDAAAKAVMKLRQRRQATGGVASGQTMAIMLDEIENLVEHKKSQWKKWAVVGGGLASLVIAVLVGVVVYQGSQMNAKVDEKKDTDAEIRRIESEIQLMGSDDPNLKGKVEYLALLTGKAQALTNDLASTDKGKQAMVKAGVDKGDFVDAEIHKILREFEAETYSVPRNFRDRVEYYLADWEKSGSYKRVWNRRREYWPMISRAFAEEGIPEVMAYVAWQESQFDPEVCSWVGARGMWQFMPATGKRYGLSISADCTNARPPSGALHCPCRGTDDRTDPYLASRAAARYLGDLLAEFGMESFMIAIASYNKGESGMRKILRDRKLRRRHERDFWNLYYLKLLPEETLEYVPRIVAAAIIGRNPAKYGLD